MRWILFLICILFCNKSFAQSDSIGTKQLQEVMITTHRVSKEVISIPYTVHKLTSDHLNNFVPRTTPESLQGMSGVFVQKTNHGGGSAFIRGLTGNQTLLLIDGIRLNNATYRYGPNQYLNTVDPFILHNNEVAKGTGSVQYGTDAIGGVIQLVTKELTFSDKKKVTGNGLVKYMTGNMEQTARASLQYASPKVAVTSGITVRKFGDLIGGDTTGKQMPSGYDEWAWNAKAAFALSKNMKLTLSHQQLTQFNVPLYHRIQLENFSVAQFDLQQHQLQYARLLIGTNNLWAKEFTITASHQQSKENRSNQRNNSFLKRNENDKVNTIAVTMQVNSQFNKNWTAITGIELYRDRVGSAAKEYNLQQNTVSSKRGLYPNAATYGNYSIFSLHTYKLKKWNIDAGIRFNSFSIKLADTSLGNVNITPAALVYNAAFTYAFNKNNRLYSNFSTGFRAPNIDDMGTLGIVDFRYEVPTNNLNPEKSYNVELGYKFRTSTLQGSIALYHMRLNDLIARVKSETEVINGFPVYRKENVEKAYIKGVEASMMLKPTSQLSVDANLTYNYGQNISRDEALRRIPPLHGKLAATYAIHSFFCSSEWLYAATQNRLAQGDKDDNRIPAGGTPGWNIYNLFVGYQFNHFKINTGLQNLFNVDYRTHGSGINGVGRSIWLSILVNLN